MENELDVDSNKTAQILNQQFTSVFTKEDKRNISTPEILFRKKIDSQLTSYEIKDENIANCIDKLKIQTTPDPDQISHRVFRKLKNELIEPLKTICNKASPSKVETSYSHPYLQEKKAWIIGKLMETILKDQIVKHLEAYNIIRDSQYGFRRGPV